MGSKLIYVVFLIALHLLSHFLPFERRSLAPDDYANLVKARSVSLKEIPAEMLSNPDRPLNFAVLTLQHKWVDDNATLGLFLIFSSSLLLLLLVFVFSNQLLKHPFPAFLAASLFCLLPFKIETYHYPASVNIHLVTSLYLLTVIAFIQFAKNFRKGWLILSLLCYTIALFWYEIGFFLPILLFLYAYLVINGIGSDMSLRNPRAARAGMVRSPEGFESEGERERKFPAGEFDSVFRRNISEPIQMVILFALPMIGYTIYRLTNAFGHAEIKHFQHHFGLSAFSTTTVDLFHHFTGRYMARHFLYGFFQFFQIERPWFWIIVGANVVFIIVLSVILNTKPRVGECEESSSRFLALRARNDTVIFSIALFLISLTPVFLNNYGGVAGRHLLLPSVSISIVLIHFFSTVKRWKSLFVPLATILLLLSQGNGWSQVIASRINGAVYKTLKEEREMLRRAKSIVIDTKSFAENIPYAWTHHDFNLFNTYYGAQAFENWGLISMVQLALKEDPPPVYIATTRPTVGEKKRLLFSISEPIAYRAHQPKEITLPLEGTAIIGFRDVFRQ